MRRLGLAAWSIIGVLILIAIAVWLMVKVSVIFPPLGLALLIIYVLNPVVSRLERRGVRRSVGAIGSYVVFLGALTLIVFLTIPFVSRQIDEFRDRWPEFQVEAIGFIEDSAGTLEDRFGFEINTSQVTCLFGADELANPDAPTDQRCDEVTQRFRERLTEEAGRLTELGTSALHVLLIFIIGPLIALYMLIDLPQLQRDFINLVPPEHRPEVLDVGARIARTVGGFFRGQLVVALIVGVMCSIGFKLIGLPFWLIIGAVAGVTNLIPLVGPFIGGGLGAIVGVVTGGARLAIGAAIVALVVQQLDNHLISPNVMKRTVNLHPGTVMLALLAGGTLAGFWGVLLAVPGVAVAKIVLGHLWATRVLGEADSPFPPASLEEETQAEIIVTEE